MYKHLKAEKLISTTAQLRDRLALSFPDAGLLKVSKEIHDITLKTDQRIRLIMKKKWLLRFLFIIPSIIVMASLALVYSSLKYGPDFLSASEFMQSFEATISTFVFVGAALFFLFSIENRARRKVAVEAIHELRSIAHVIDMHQINKDPKLNFMWVCHPDHETSESLTNTELGKYFDYCSDLLSLIGKIAALYIQNFPDPVAMAAVDQVESLTTGLSRKIWQKRALLENLMHNQNSHTHPEQFLKVSA